MKIIHILRSEPDELTRAFIEEVSKDKEPQEICLYAGISDYEDLVQSIFRSEQVISWW